MHHDTALTPDVKQDEPLIPCLNVSRPDWYASQWIVRHDQTHRIDSLIRAVRVDYQTANTVLEILGIAAAYGTLVLDDGATTSDAVVASARATYVPAMETAAAKLGIMRMNAGSVHVSAFRMRGRTEPVFVTEWRASVGSDSSAPVCRCHARTLSHVLAKSNITYRIQTADRVEQRLRETEILTDVVDTAIRYGKRAKK